MANGDVHLLEQMRRRWGGWGEDDLDRLYRSFGFREITRPRAPHRVYVHPDYPDLHATVGRHRSLAHRFRITLTYCPDATFRSPSPLCGRGKGEGDRRVPFGCGNPHCTLTPPSPIQGEGGEMSVTVFAKGCT